MALDVVVVGAGLSGLVAAYRLHQAGCSVRVLEAAGRPGGVIGSERHDGALFERGPNSAMDTSGATIALLGDLGIAAERIDAGRTASRRYVVCRGRLMALPTSPGSFVATPVFSTAAKLRLFAEPFIGRAPAGAEESIAQFVRRRLGRELLDYAVEPFVSGIYAGDPEQLSLSAAFPRLHELEQRFGSLSLGAIRAARERRRLGAPRRLPAVSFSFREGMQTLTDALAAALPAVQCGATVRSLSPSGDGRWRIESVGAGDPVHQARAVVLALPAYGAAPMIGALAPRAADALAAIAYAPVAVVVSVYRRADIAHPLDGFGFLAPAIERPRLLGTLFSSTMFEQRAAAGTVVLTTFLGGLRNPAQVNAPDGELLRTVHQELVRLIGARGEPSMTQITRWPRAIPQYSFGHRDRIAALEQAERDYPGLIFCSNYRGGVSISDCVSRATEAAGSVVRLLGKTGKDG